MQLDKAIKERHSVRRFTSRKPNWRDIIEALESARLTPLAGNIPTIKFVVVTDKEEIEQLAEACQQDFVGTVDYVIVVCSDKQQIVRSYDERGIRYARQQAGAAIEHLLLKLVDLGLSTCWVGEFVDEQVKRILHIQEKDNIDIEALFPIGYELGKGKPRVKPSLDQILFFNTWKNKYMSKLKQPEAI